MTVESWQATSHVISTMLLEPRAEKEVLYMRNENTSIIMISVKLQNKERVSAEPLLHMSSYARMRCEGQE